MAIGRFGARPHWRAGCVFTVGAGFQVFGGYVGDGSGPRCGADGEQPALLPADHFSTAASAATRLPPLCYNSATIAAIRSRPTPDAQPGPEPADDYSPPHHNRNPAVQ